jgi:putative FmdB family regulatory protein
VPLYEYECPGCGTFERVQKFSDPILTACPTCEKPVEKLISAPAIQFKGTGWYVTDYAKKGSDGEKDSGEPKAKTSGEGKDTGSSKDKPAKKDSSSSSPSSSSSSKSSSSK